MTTRDTARDIVRPYFDAWTSGDMARARTYLADDLDFQGAIDRFNRADAFVPALSGFAGMLVRTDLLHEFYTDDAAALLYDCVSPTPAGTIRTAEFLRVKDGKIVEIRLVFDASELRKLMGR
ncbi:MAG: nuclear transport factor 2 family protein [Acidobacteriota bacterium]